MTDRTPRRRRLTVLPPALGLAAALVLAGCASSPPDSSRSDESGAPPGDGTTLTLAFAGDVHFEGRVAGLLDDPQATLGPMSRHLRDADLAMVNLESAVAERGSRADKGLEDPSARYWFRSPPAALEILERSGVDVVTVANNHGADYGIDGLRQTLDAAQDGPVAVVGVGRDEREAFEPHRVTVAGTDIAVLAADAAPRESEDSSWAVREGGPGLASARRDGDKLAAAVRRADETDDLVVAYLHWGRSGERCPTGQQRRLAEKLAAAGADVVVGSHAHVLLGGGMLEDTYVGYGLGNFLWYHGARSRTGVLELQVTDGRVTGEQFVPARIPAGGGQPQTLSGDGLAQARSQWEGARGCTGLAPPPDPAASAGGGTGARDDAGARPRGGGDGLPDFEAQVRRLGPSLRDRTARSHDPEACPVALGDLRHLTLSHVGFDGAHHTGEMVVRARHAADVVGVFEKLYDERWPIRRMRLVDEYDADDDRSMAADNTSAYNCRRVAGQETWSAHAYGAAIDINPRENPYVVGEEVRPPAGRRFTAADRSAGGQGPPGVIRRDDVVTRAFADVGWTWGGTFSDPDYQHFTAR